MMNYVSRVSVIALDGGRTLGRTRKAKRIKGLTMKPVRIPLLLVGRT